MHGIRCTLSSAATGRLKACGMRGITFGCIGREKFGYGEAYLSEGVAGIFRIAGAFLCRHAEVICGNQHLHISFKLNDRE